MFNARHFVLAAIFAGTALTSTAKAQQEGGYVAVYNMGAETSIYNFIRHFYWDQFYYAPAFTLAGSNNSYVDAMDHSIFCGHGNNFYVVGIDNVGVNLKTVGYGANKGIGDFNNEFLTFYSCKVVPGATDNSQFLSGWTNPGGAFDGVHQIMGFRTLAYTSHDEDVTDLYGEWVSAGFGIWTSWFNALDAEAYSYEHGSAIIYPPAMFDTRFNTCEDPPANSTYAICFWQS